MTALFSRTKTGARGESCSKGIATCGSANNPDDAADEQIMAALDSTTLRQTGDRMHKEIEKLDRRGCVLALYKRVYAPNNAILVIAGTFDAQYIRRGETCLGAVRPPAGSGPKAVRQERCRGAELRDAVRSERRTDRTAARLIVPSSATAAAGESPAPTWGRNDGRPAQIRLYRALRW